MIPTIAVLAVTALTLALGTVGLRFARTTSNFFVASRSVHPVWNAFAVSGEAMSAASYLGLPALIMVFGVDLLWALLGWTVGFLMLSLFMAAPVRRFGSYTIPEFIEGRLDAPHLRPVVAVMVIVVTWFFLLAHLKGAGVGVPAHDDRGRSRIGERSRHPATKHACPTNDDGDPVIELERG